MSESTKAAVNSDCEAAVFWVVSLLAMRALVDYDNVPDHIVRQGPLYLADRLFEVVRPHFLDDTHLELKLYGGWYDQQSLTRKAQDIVARLADFPYPIWIKDRTPPHLVRITASLAHSLETLPKKLIHSTFRQRPPARRFSCDHPGLHGCNSGSCPLLAGMDFINNQHCPTPGCAVTPRVLFRAVGEQKLVDTMIVADAIHLAKQGDATVILVTSDDDVWPAIISARVMGTHVVHVRTGMSTSNASYNDGIPGKYTEVNL